MSTPHNVIDAMIEMIDFFLQKCHETSTLEKVKHCALNNKQWKNAHKLFDEIRNKTLETEKTGDIKLEWQYLFEEYCAKTLYNIHCYACEIEDPFDPDSPFWILPTAIGLGRKLGVYPDFAKDISS
jgi:hypothetical protein